MTITPTLMTVARLTIGPAWAWAAKKIRQNEGPFSLTKEGKVWRLIPTRSVQVLALAVDGTPIDHSQSAFSWSHRFPKECIKEEGGYIDFWKLRPKLKMGMDPPKLLVVYRVYTFGKVHEYDDDSSLIKEIIEQRGTLLQQELRRIFPARVEPTLTGLSSAELKRRNREEKAARKSIKIWEHPIE